MKIRWVSVVLTKERKLCHYKPRIPQDSIRTQLLMNEKACVARRGGMTEHH
jgi:hypothetical protein